MTAKPNPYYEQPSAEERAERKKMSIAALYGAGIPLADIARVTAVPTAGITYIIEKRIPKEDALNDIFHAFRDEVKPLVRSTLAKAFAQLDQRLTSRSKKITIDQLVKVITSIGPIAGFFNDQNPNHFQKLTARVDMNDPKVVEAMFTAMKKEREARVVELKGG